MWTRCLDKTLFPLRISSISNIKRSTTSIYLVREYTKRDFSNLETFHDLKLNPDKKTIDRVFDNVFTKSPINIKDSYRMNDFLEAISTIPHEHHSTVREYLYGLKNDATTNVLIRNITLQLLISDVAQDHAKTYQYIVDNLDGKLSNDLLEVFLFNLIECENLGASTTLLHILYDRVPDFKLSNELWSFYVSKVCELGYYLGSCLVYHELIDNHKAYSENISGVYHQNSHVPFLVNNFTLEKLAIIFQHNKDPIRVKGLLDYFKRFYSYAGHSDTYKSLRISLVEAHSNEGNLGEALKQFRTLVFILKGHRNYQTNEKNTHRISAFNHFRWRRDNIKNNDNDSKSEVAESEKTGLDIQEEMTASISNTTLFRPDEERNVYTYPGTSYAPVVDGSIEKNDMPYLHSLVKSNVQHLMENSGPERLDSLINSITSCHFSLHTFINSSLCELGYLREAFLLMIKIPKLYPKVQVNVIIREEDFIFLFNACKQKLDVLNDDPTKLSEIEDIYEFIGKVNIFRNNINQKITDSHQSFKIYEALVSTLLSYQSVTKDDLRVPLESLLSKKKLIYLCEKDFTKLKSLCTSHEDKKYFKTIMCKD